ncbi:zinc finger and BTB domain-containing protein 11-like [Crotalus adamanteus]|uniref:Zinc finger and BTB domain-containing protein 11-like n=1 Tax=Crotalus adamanteus TaxID=8729 RepID=A0AAW1C081_CROAD
MFSPRIAGSKFLGCLLSLRAKPKLLLGLVVGGGGRGEGRRRCSATRRSDVKCCQSKALFWAIAGGIHQLPLASPPAMSSEESYLAILCYLTNERKPYAPGTEGNLKHKIRKAATCSVMHGGTLYYQRQQQDQQCFAELKVVLQAERRTHLIWAAHFAQV